MDLKITGAETDNYKLLFCRTSVGIFIKFSG